MTETAAVSPVHKFCDEWSVSFVSVVESLGATDVTATWSAPLAPAPAVAETAAEPDTSVPSYFQIKGAFQGYMTLLCDKTVAVQFGQLLQSEACDPAAELSDMQRDAFTEFLRTVAGDLATGWKAETSQQIEIVLESVAQPRSPGAQTATLELKSDKFAALSVQLLVDPALCAALVATAATPPAEIRAPEPAAAVAAGAGASRGATDPLAAHLLAGPAPNLALLLDVELEATIRFGQRDMLLREVFGLMPGAVVELDQLVNEPAELLVAGRLIARGEVVVVDGNFGLRVTEVAATGQREALMDL
jgi:flagellar motor switch protein FliN